MDNRLENYEMIVGEGVRFSLNDYKTRVNNNVLLVGGPGSGKTTQFVKPNLYQAQGSYVIHDPKGRLYDELGDYYRKKGYRVKVLDFRNPERSDHYNPMYYLNSAQDVRSMSQLLSYRSVCRNDPAWNEFAHALISALIAYLWKEAPMKMRNIKNLVKLVSMMSTSDANVKSEVDRIFEGLPKDSMAVRQYRKVRCCPTNTWQSILLTVNAALDPLENEEINVMTDTDDIQIETIGEEKTVVFVIVSDADRSMDALANLFFLQSIQILYRHADEECGGRLPVPVRFIMDDIGNSLEIPDFPKIISSCRSRGISYMVVLQSEGQLRNAYGDDADTIIAGCDTYIFSGGNDLNTIKAVAEKSGTEMRDVMCQKIGTSWVFRRGQMPMLVDNYDMEKHRREFDEAVVFTDG